MRSQIREITWNDETYFKVYAENVSNRMVLLLKKKFKTEEEAREAAKAMLPTYELDQDVKRQVF